MKMPDDKDQKEIGGDPTAFIKDEYRSVEKVKKDFNVSPFEKYSGRFSASFGTLFLGVVLSVIGLVLLGYSEGTDNAVNIVRRSPLIQAENLIRNTGMIKLNGYPTAQRTLSVPNSEDELTYYVKITEEKIDGEWVEVSKQQAFAPFDIGGIEVDASNADLYFDLVDLSTVESDVIRETYKGVLASEKLVVVGHLNDNVINEGVVFVITNKSSKDLLSAMSNMGTLEWWLYKIGALLLITLGITSFILPILTFLDIFPHMGLSAIGLIMLFSLLMSAMLVFIAAIVITFWWLIFIIIGLVVILLIRIKSKKKVHNVSFVP